MKKLAALSLIAGLGFSGLASAESTTGNASALLLTTLSFVEDQVVDFGTIPNGTGTCVMASTGALNGHCNGLTGTVGQFTVSGTPSQNISYSLSGGSTDAGVTFTPYFDDAASVQAGSGSLDGSGDATINVQGQLDLVAAAGGARSMTYTLTVNYQ